MSERIKLDVMLTSDGPVVGIRDGIHIHKLTEKECEEGAAHLHCLRRGWWVKPVADRLANAIAHAEAHPYPPVKRSRP